MKITIDNLNGAGVVDYSGCLDISVAPKVLRTLNVPTSLSLSLVAASSSSFVVPLVGARVVVAKNSGASLFTGYLTNAPECEYLGWGKSGAVYRYNLVALSDEVLLDRKALPNRAGFVNRTAGGAIKQLAQDLLPGAFDVSAVADVDTLASYAANPQKNFSEHAGAIASAARGCYRAMDGALSLLPVGDSTNALSESDANFSAAALTLKSPAVLANDVTAIGLDEPQAYVRDYFVGDNATLKFYLSQKPFAQSKKPLIDEKFLGAAVDPTTWTVNDPSSAISVAAGSLQVAGGTGGDGATVVQFVEQVELGGALQLQHGDVSFSASSQGILGGLYSGGVSVAACVAGFQVTPSGGQSSIQAVVNGVAAGPSVATQLGHRYVLSTYLYSTEVYRSQQTFHSSGHPAGSGWGGAAVPADVRVVLEVHDVDPSDPTTLLAPATVLFDDVISNAPGFCTYALVNAASMHCGIAFPYVTHVSLAEVRTAPAGGSYSTQLVGALADGANCLITSDPALNFYAYYVPALNSQIVVSYRGLGRAVADIQNSASVASLHSGGDDGTRGVVRAVKAPSARTSADCENAALAMLEDFGGVAWSGSYTTWSDFLPGGAADIFPGDAIAVNVPSRGAVFTAVVRSVEIEMRDPAGDRGVYAIAFANDSAAPLALVTEQNATTVSLQDAPLIQSTGQVGNFYLPDLKDAQITEITSTTVTIDAGVAPAAGQGIEVRIHDYGFGQSNDRNLLGRFGSQVFTLPRLGKTQNYFLRLYDSSLRYSRYSAALHLAVPF